MRIKVKPGRYVLAVSGGVDSMVLLDLLAKKPGIELVVAHFNHGIRKDSAADEKLVSKAANDYGQKYEAGHGRLGPRASEETAREARYKFLRGALVKYNAKAIVTAHHQDDLIETAFINLLRGTGRKGLSAIQDNKLVLRPLLKFSKEEILKYAYANNIKWREDITNSDETYLRNYIRKNLMTNLSGGQRIKIMANIEKVAKNEGEINLRIEKLSQLVRKNNQISRASFASLPVNLGDELVAYWLRQNNHRDLDKKIINRVNLAIKTGRAGTLHPVQGCLSLKLSAKSAEFVNRV